MNEVYTKEQIIEKMNKELTEEQCQQIISIWSMRPQPGTPTGQAWEQGAVWGWNKCRESAKYYFNNPKR
jgi:hypothetical protein